MLASPFPPNARESRRARIRGALRRAACPSVDARPRTRQSDAQTFSVRDAPSPSAQKKATRDSSSIARRKSSRHIRALVLES
ncbi:MAG: hypothetical protein D6744_08285 [Planctomycetota bacterium]|nr:MAG: hypothetical protein D6744_08285 [Planctomycetota bacterium]